MSTLLAFDTATEQMSVALAARGRVWAVDAPGGATASATLIPAILGLLAGAELALRDLDAIAFGRGPGAFTGLRTACSVAQGLALGAGKPVLPIDTLLAVAEDARAGADKITLWVAMDARMNEIYAAEYRFGAGRWQVVQAPMLVSPEALNQRWHDAPPQCVAGSALAAFGAQLQAPGAVLLPDAGPRAAALLPLAQAAWVAGAGLDAALALPLYLRDKVALTTVERDAVRALKVAATAVLGIAR